jgi:hypothetical protein
MIIALKIEAHKNLKHCNHYLVKVKKTQIHYKKRIQIQTKKIVHLLAKKLNLFPCCQIEIYHLKNLQHNKKS